MDIEKFVDTPDGQKIGFNHFKNNKESVLIIAHGWFMCKDTKPFISMSKDFLGHHDVIAMDFRGHGKSSGLFTFTAKEPQDLEAIVTFAKKEYVKVYLLGFSLGGAIVILHSAKHNNIDGSIAVSAPADFNKIENHCWKPEAFMPTFKKFDIRENRNIRPGNPFLKKIKPIDVVDKILTPTLFVAGKKDPTVYPWHTKQLYEKATCEKSYELFEYGFHSEDLYLNSKVKFIDICTSWLN